MCHKRLRKDRRDKEGEREKKSGGGCTGSTFVCISSHNRKRPVASPSQWLRFCFPPPAFFPGGGGGEGRGGVDRQAPQNVWLINQTGPYEDRNTHTYSHLHTHTHRCQSPMKNLSQDKHLSYCRRGAGRQGLTQKE